MDKELPDIYAFLIDRTARLMKQYSKKRFAEIKAGITIEQWPLLKWLSENRPISQRELAEATLKDGPTITRILDLLANKELIERLSDPTDRRRFLVRLTTKGKKKVAKLMPEVEAQRATGWQGLNDKDYADLKRILGKIEQNFT